MIPIEKTKFVITAAESSWLIFTSTLNIFPILLALTMNVPFYSWVSFGTGFFSILYWIHPIHGWRRTLDLYYAKFSFLVYLCSGMYYLPFGLPVVVLYGGALAIFLTYSLTYVFPHIWLRFHIMFHLLGIGMKLYILCFVPYTLEKSWLSDIY
jgi:hypothetical protein